MVADLTTEEEEDEEGGNPNPLNFLKCSCPPVLQPSLLF
jgi:hypothetical protein